MDYSKVPAAGTPTWLKLSREDSEKNAEQKDVAGLEKENAKPASAERMARKAAANQKFDLSLMEQGKSKGRPPLARKDEDGDVTAKVIAGKQGKANQSSAPTADAANAADTAKETKNKGKKRASASVGEAAENAQNTEAKQRSKARQSAPMPTDKRPEIQENKRKSAPGQQSTKRPLPEASHNAKPADKAAKRIKPSRSDAAKGDAPANSEPKRQASKGGAAQPADSRETQKTAPRASGGAQAKQHAESQPRKLRQAEAHQAAEQQRIPAEQRAADKHVTSRPGSKSDIAPLPPPIATAVAAAAEPDNFRKLQVHHLLTSNAYPLSSHASSRALLKYQQHTCVASLSTYGVLFGRRSMLRCRASIRISRSSAFRSWRA